jgi:hypothetical protein
MYTTVTVLSRAGYTLKKCSVIHTHDIHAKFKENRLICSNAILGEHMDRSIK